MLCYQCEQTARGTGCTTMGVCGKDAVTAALQDLLKYQTKLIGRYAHRAHQLGVRDSSSAAFIEDALFTTVTNVNFDPARLQTLLRESERVLANARSRYESACRSAGKKPTEFPASPVSPLAANINGLVAQGERIGIASRHTQLGVELTGLQELLTAGLK
ncbi:MAG: hydroxylamine reductase, partial [Kiritimatiellota bacterium]|nr:hydroxylamine reductase [Kiritimatiellota bacterium]